MKDEADGKIIEEFVGLRAKLYSCKLLKEHKGIKKNVVKQRITHIGL